MTGPLAVVARCEKCGREFVSLGESDTDQFPPLGWRPAGGWTKWRGDSEAAPLCGGRIVLLAASESQPQREVGE